MPPRLYYWFALAGALAGIGLGLIKIQQDEVALAAFVLAFVFVLVGGIGELLVPFLIWQFGRFGKCDRAGRVQIALGESLLKQPIVTQDEATHWDALTQQVLRKFLGGPWHQEFRNYLRVGGINQQLEEERRRRVSAKVHVLISLRKAVENRTISVLFDENVKLS
jgi:hypothetical protein